VSERGATLAASRRAARELALAAVFEAEFGQRTSERALERRIGDRLPDAEASSYARELVQIATSHRADLDALIAEAAPAYPVTQLARIDRSLLRLALGELLHSPATPVGVTISEWVELAKSYSGEPAKRLLNGILGRVAETRGSQQAPGPIQTHTEGRHLTAAPSEEAEG
jgi:N utilization substance protein B